MQAHTGNIFMRIGSAQPILSLQVSDAALAGQSTPGYFHKKFLMLNRDCTPLSILV